VGADREERNRKIRKFRKEGSTGGCIRFAQ
jgi:hypothetical protein